ncbi:uncharacterized protein GGS22DRAFT_191502 [Annulohypoxylon maeteangense]|uniref:uncharacterized protein n=1 Tax=Annulohypoxylon maeteangense TaxID=1927788 RepID=UPI002008024A|nr:uncharacterized protein GGS22DRAFT_191502 [Annulohypoxylon maeteangense]KAI0882331.1 hypothetical protein GGS22DRAFT_191502 [Annulohypoxylon maeteangense]
MSSLNSTCISGSAPVALSQKFLCNPGFYCPNNSATTPPQYCAPTPECLLTRLQTVRNICNDAQGIYEPLVCPPGHYCSLGGKQISICPQGYFCPLGSAEPFRCGITSICPEGADRELVMDGFIFIFILDSIILALLLKSFRRVLDIIRWRILRTCIEKSTFVASPELSHIDTISEGNLRIEDENVRKFVASVRSCVGQGDVGFSFGFEELSLVLANGKTILAPQSGHIPKGSIWGVMGPSGAGKSSFVNVLMGKTKQTTGQIYVNKVAWKTVKYKKLIGYVPQDDIIMSECTIRESILHSAIARLPRKWSDKQRNEHVDTIISCLGLTDIQDRIIGDQISWAISGGQRKRVSIGIELAAAPIALVLDEPTSGLDATASLSIMRLLRTLSKLGVTVVCIIHQPRPEILEFLSGVTLLSRGYQVYHGESSGLTGYFSHLGFDISGKPNIGDAVLDIISGQYALHTESYRTLTIHDLVESWRSNSSRIQPPLETNEQMVSSSYQVELLARSASGRGQSRTRQTYLCFVRSMKQQWRRMNSFILEIAVGSISGLLIGLSLYQLRGQHFQGAYYPPFQILSSALNYTTVPEIGLLCSLAIGLAAAAPGVKTFGEEKQMYWREASAGHSRSAYYIGKVIATIPRLTISAMHFTTFYCILATPRMSFWTMYLTNLMYFYCIYGLASTVSTVVRREDGPLLAMIVSLVIGVFGGYGPPLYNVKEWHLEWFWRLCPGIWLTEAYFDQHLIISGHLYDLDAAARWTGYVRGRFGTDVLLLLVIGTVYRLAAFAGLVFIDRNRQK